MENFTITIDVVKGNYYVMVQSRWANGNVRDRRSETVYSYDTAIATVRRMCGELEIIKE